MHIWFFFYYKLILIRIHKIFILKLRKPKMQEKSSSKSTSQSSDQQEKGYVLLRTDTIQLWACLEEYQPLDEHLLKSLSEDISYRIRETTDVLSFSSHLFFLYFNIC